MAWPRWPFTSARSHLFWVNWPHFLPRDLQIMASNTPRDWRRLAGKMGGTFWNQEALQNLPTAEFSSKSGATCSGSVLSSA